MSRRKLKPRRPFDTAATRSSRRITGSSSMLLHGTFSQMKTSGPSAPRLTAPFANARIGSVDLRKILDGILAGDVAAHPESMMLPLVGHPSAPQPITWMGQGHLPGTLPPHLFRVALFTLNTGERDYRLAARREAPGKGKEPERCADDVVMTQHDSVAQVVTLHAALKKIREDTGRWNRRLVTPRGNSGKPEMPASPKMAHTKKNGLAL